MRSIISAGEGGEETLAGTTDWRLWECKLQLVMDAVDQSICGLWILSQGKPRTMGDVGNEIMYRMIISLWLPEIMSVRGAV